jgi:hypothetical protein
MGTGLMTFDTVPGWGLTAEGKSAIGPTHGGVIVGKDGTIYTSADKGVIAFSPDGKVAREFLGEPYTNLHDIETAPNTFTAPATKTLRGSSSMQSTARSPCASPSLRIPGSLQSRSTQPPSPCPRTVIFFSRTATPATLFLSSTKPVNT